MTSQHRDLECKYLPISISLLAFTVSMLNYRTARQNMSTKALDDMFKEHRGDALGSARRFVDAEVNADASPPWRRFAGFLDREQEVRGRLRTYPCRAPGMSGAHGEPHVPLQPSIEPEAPNSNDNPFRATRRTKEHKISRVADIWGGFMTMPDRLRAPARCAGAAVEPPDADGPEGGA
ncbi:hypothetical protein [Tsukamurella sp. NPDC003166]|uniref:hypothetical protein n=1 Tax=Tsukamurella sp. NPDC003166 TaxID=3154444 RepID=UPI0033B1C78D